MLFSAATAGLFMISPFAAMPALAAVPELINFQGKLTNSTSKAVTTVVPMVFKFYTAAAGGSAVWTETRSVTPDSDGIYSVQLGEVTPFNISFSTAYWLGVTVGTDSEMLPRYRIVSSAYALYSLNSGTAAWAGGADWTHITNKPSFSAGDVSLASTQTFTGTNNFQTITTTSTCIAGDCRTAWPIGFAGGTVPDQTIFQSTVTVANLAKVIIVDGINYPQTGAGIQAAINAAPSGGTVFIPSGNYFLSASLTIPNSVNLVGAGWGVGSGGSALGTFLRPNFSGPAILVQPTATTGGIQGGSLKNFGMRGVSAFGSSGSYYIQFDGTNGQIHNFIIDSLYMDGSSAYAIYADDNNSKGTPSVTTIENSVIYGGIFMANAGDTIRFINNQISNSGAIDISFVGGASTFIMKGNNISSFGGIHLGANTFAAQIISNEIETQTGFTGSNGAVLDIDGDASNVTIENNNFQVVNNSNANAIRVNNADRTHIAGNMFERGVAPANDIVVTASASDTFIGTNLWHSGLPFSRMLSDSGVRTVLATEFGTGFLIGNSQFLTAVDDAGDQSPLAGISSGGQTNYYGYHGRSALAGTAGATYIYDGSGASNIAGVFSSQTPAQSVTGVAKFGGVVTAFSTQSSDYTLTATNRWVNVTGATTVTVPHAIVGQSWVVFNSGSQTVTIKADSGNINGAANVTRGANTGYEVSCDGTNCFAH